MWCVVLEATLTLMDYETIYVSQRIKLRCILCFHHVGIVPHTVSTVSFHADDMLTE